MAISIVIKDDKGRQVKNITLDPGQDEKKWEEVSYRVGCEVARQVAGLLIEFIEERILQERPKTWKVKDSKERNHVTRFVTVSRWLYKDDKGVSHFLLDEYLDWPPYRVATPSLSEALLELIVLGGDDADWVNKGEEELPYCIRQMDGFHLSRSCRRGWEQGGDIYDAIRTGRIRQTLGITVEREGKTAQKERTHVLKCLDRGVDWCKQMGGMPFIIPEGVRGLGTMESNEDKLFADRMKKKGLSWTIPGAQRMGKAIQMVANDELREWCGRLDQRKSSSGRDTLCFDVFTYPPEYENSASVPALVGSHSSRPWVMALCDLISHPYPLN